MNLLYNHPVAAAITVCLIAYGAAAAIIIDWNIIARWYR